MRRYYIRHKVKTGDIVHLSDQDSERIIQNKWHREEDFIELEAEGKLFRAQITFIDRASVEVEVFELIQNLATSSPATSKPNLKIIQSLSNERKFDYFLEKAVELGVREVYPIQSDYSLLSAVKSRKLMIHWQDIVKNATEQSRTTEPTIVNEPIILGGMNFQELQNYSKLCLVTEQISTKSLKETMQKNNDIVVAIGPEKGWSSQDLKIFNENGFIPTRLGKNILRTETCGLVIASIFNFINEEYK